MNEETQAGVDFLREEISNAELHEVLERLGEDSFGGSGLSRVGDLIEATGAPPDLVAAHLADIRRGDWEARFGQRQDAVEERVERHDETLQSHGKAINDLRAKSSGSARLSDREVHGTGQQKVGGRTGVLIAVVGIVLGFGYVFVTSRPSQPTVPTLPGSSHMSLQEETLQMGDEEYVKRDGKWVNRKTGASSGMADAFARGLDERSNRSGGR